MPAAGTGQRAGLALPKQYAALAGRTVIEWALSLFIADARCRGITVALAAGDAYFGTLAAARERQVSTVRGGAQRSDSVLAALEALDAPEDEWVLVHDAARPCVTRMEIDSLLETAGADPIGGLLAVPLADTLKRESRGQVRDTPSRESLWRALTPQMFRLGALRAALRAAGKAQRIPTDESQAMEWLGHSPRLVAGSAQNLKITTTADLTLAAAVLSQRGEYA